MHESMKTPVTVEVRNALDARTGFPGAHGSYDSLDAAMVEAERLGFEKGDDIVYEDCFCQGDSERMKSKLDQRVRGGSAEMMIEEDFEVVEVAYGGVKIQPYSLAQAGII